MPRRLWRIGMAGTLLLGSLAAARGDPIDQQLSAIAGTGPDGKGSSAARAACDALSERRAEILPRLLRAMETDNPVAANWARSAYEAIVERELKGSDSKFPVDDLRAIVQDPKRSGRVRRLTLALCDRLEPGYAKKVIPHWLEDPEFRDDAVEMALAAGQQALESGDSETARDAFDDAFRYARDSGQTVRAAGRLSGLGERVDIAQHLGLVVDWWLVGPFDAPGFSGFAREFPPQQKVDLQAAYAGQEGRTIAWVRHRTTDPLGLVNLVQALAPAKEAVAYAYTELISPGDQAAQLRCGADDNCTVWLNGQKVFSRDQWLNGTRFDRFITPVQLRRGPNRLLVKVCQGPQHVDPQVANLWSLQLRFCDDKGNGLPLRSTLAEIPGAAP